MDWMRFLEEHQIGFVTRSANTKRGEVSIHCPICGDEDPSMHLGINLTTGNWGCLRDGSHRGKSARHLVKNVLGCSSAQAFTIVRQYSHSDPDSLESALAALEPNPMAPADDVQQQKRIQRLNPDFVDFSKIKPRGTTARFFRYLESRGYDNPQDVITEYGLKCALTGRYKDRIIIPVRHNGELLGWTSRAIGAPKSAPRYLASSEDVKTTVLNYDAIKKGGERLFIVEGPFDAIRLDSYCLTHKAEVPFRATCTFGTSVTIGQIAILRTLVKKYDQAYVLFDKGAEGPAEELATWLGIKVATLPNNIEDPGDLEKHHLEQASLKAFVGEFEWSMYSGAWSYLRKSATPFVRFPLAGNKKAIKTRP